jgi:predicted flap endonuclease-1-like 5' DNA nuclease
MGTPLTNVRGIGESTARDLQAHGIMTCEDLANASIEEISAVPGFGPARAKSARESAAAAVQASAPVAEEIGRAHV